jgi:hypothetical protein
VEGSYHDGSGDACEGNRDDVPVVSAPDDTDPLSEVELEAAAPVASAEALVNVAEALFASPGQDAACGTWTPTLKIKKISRIGRGDAVKPWQGGPRIRTFCKD